MKDTKKQGNTRRSINDVRAPLMMLYVAAFCGGRMGEVPVWLLLLCAAPAITALAFIFERKLMKELLAWNTRWVLVSVSASVILYVIMNIALQAASGVSIEGALIKEDGSLPVLFQLLLSLKGDIAVLHPAVAGLVGAVVLGISEEFFWRGFVQARVMIWLGHIPAVVFTAVLYAGFYAVMIGALAAVAAGLCGLVFSFVTLRSRSLVPAMIGHALLWIAGIWLLPLV